MLYKAIQHRRGYSNSLSHNYFLIDAKWEEEAFSSCINSMHACVGVYMDGNVEIVCVAKYSVLQR